MEQQQQQQQQQQEPANSAALTMSITLRRFELSDLDDYMVWASDDKVSRFCRWEAYTDKSHLLAYMEESVLPHPYFRAICVGARPVGAVSVTPGAGENACRAEIGYVLASDYWGKGVATAAVRIAVAEVFDAVEGLERVEGFVDVENRGSQRVLEKVGFTREGC
uniref:N-acetyltransferase domain-containing protein n=1 Tax=Ananas comosus var. bracteatus TaxID=296719 RepID=A0A6V7NMI4_ANACO|nr:unnamed protein product [Ananas comosus var. bracteatus]